MHFSTKNYLKINYKDNFITSKKLPGKKLHAPMTILWKNI